MTSKVVKRNQGLSGRGRGGSEPYKSFRPIYPTDIQFPKMPVESKGSLGTRYIRWVTCGMPKLGQYTPLLKAVIFLYPDHASAKAGVQAGGTGFIIGVPFKDFPDLMCVHVVTNYHVAVFNKNGPPSPVVRVNCLAGKPEILEFDPSEWVFTPGGPDIAISPPFALDELIHEFAAFDIEGWLLTPEEEAKDEVGPGEDVFMIGRFVDCDGVDTNQPAARFGHISMMDVKIEQGTGYKGRSIVLDMHSRSGFSGSPVFVYRTLGSHFMEHKPNAILTNVGHYMKMLGIHYAQFPEEWEIKQRKTNAPVTQASLQADSHYVQGLSGMTCVIPATEIKKLLYSPELTQMRDKINDHLLANGKKPSGGPQNESARPQATDENPNAREDFTRLANAAARKQTQGE